MGACSQIYPPAGVFDRALPEQLLPGPLCHHHHGIALLFHLPKTKQTQYYLSAVLPDFQSFGVGIGILHYTFNQHTSSKMTPVDLKLELKEAKIMLEKLNY